MNIRGLHLGGGVSIRGLQPLPPPPLFRRLVILRALRMQCVSPPEDSSDRSWGAGAKARRPSFQKPRCARKEEASEFVSFQKGVLAVEAKYTYAITNMIKKLLPI